MINIFPRFSFVEKCRTKSQYYLAETLYFSYRLTSVYFRTKIFHHFIGNDIIKVISSEISWWNNLLWCRRIKILLYYSTGSCAFSRTPRNLPWFYSRFSLSPAVLARAYETQTRRCLPANALRRWYRSSVISSCLHGRLSGSAGSQSVYSQ